MAADNASMPESRETPPTLQPRREVLRRRALRQGWLLVLAGLVVPVFALVGGLRGWLIRDLEPVRGAVLAAVGTLVFVVRLALYLS